MPADPDPTPAPDGSPPGTGGDDRRGPLSRRALLRAGLVVPALGLPFAAACSEGGGGASQRVPEKSPGGVQARGTAPERRGPLGSGQPVTFAFGGDVHFPDERDTIDPGAISPVVLADQLRSDPIHLLAPVAPVLAGADLAMVDLETAITDRGAPVAGKEFHFRSPAESFEALKAAGVNVITMANNHALDYGPVGMEDTFAAIASSKIPVVGIGHNATEAFAPYRTEIKGQRIAIFGACDWLEPGLVSQWTATDTQPGVAFSIDRARLVASMTQVRPEVDTLVVFLHWGVEDTHCASPEQSELAQAMLAAGADLVVGSHAHRVFGAGRVGTALVAYGLGNFVWWREDGGSGQSGVLKVQVTGRQVDAYQWVPARITDGVPVPETGAPAAADLATWASLRNCSALSA